MERTLLLVDDEPNIIRALVRSLRDCDFQVLTASSGSEALEVLEKNSVDVILSDQRMPNMTGVQFLRIAKERYPNTVRMVLSGYTDLNSITDAINHGAIYKFLTKPWDDELLKANIEEAFDYAELRFENERLKSDLNIANQKLSTVNQSSEIRAKITSEEPSLNFQNLKVAQEVLEKLPIGVVSVDDDEKIILANRVAREVLSCNGGVLTGCPINVLLPEIYQFMTNPNRDQFKNSLIETDKGRWTIDISTFGIGESVRGTLLLCLPIRTSMY